MKYGRFTLLVACVSGAIAWGVSASAWSQEFLSCRAPSHSFLGAHARPGAIGNTVRFHAGAHAAGILPFLRALDEPLKECPSPMASGGPPTRLAKPRGASPAVVSGILRELVGDDSVALLGIVPSVAIERGQHANAFARKSQVVLTVPLLEQVSDRSELAFVIAHELGHLSLGHEADGRTVAELEADAIALELVQQAGFDPCAGTSVLRRLAQPNLRRLVSVPERLRALENEIGAQCAS